MVLGIRIQTKAERLTASIFCVKRKRGVLVFLTALLFLRVITRIELRKPERLRLSHGASVFKVT